PPAGPPQKGTTSRAPPPTAGRGPRSAPESPEGTMSSDMPRLFLARHGDTAWTDSHQRTGRTDLPLNQHGEERARLIGEQLQRFTFARVFTSPLRRAATTCAMAGY